MNFFQKHADAATVIGVLLAVFGIMQAEFKDIRCEIKDLRKEVGMIKEQLTMIKTVLILKNILPQELVMNDKADVVPISKKDIMEENSR